MSSDESSSGMLACLEDSGSEFLPDSDSSDSDILSDIENNVHNYKAKPKKQTTPRNADKTKKRKLNGDASLQVLANKPSNSKSPANKKKVVNAVKAFNKREERPFNSFMNGVVFVISGYENPLRSELRNKATAMGARYEANWSCNSTHLICAFRNTPKYNQVRGQGKIVKKEWIEKCYSQRVRLPWRRFALDNNDASQAESEEEIYELIDRPSASAKRSASASASDGDADTDEEIERVRQKQKKVNGCHNVNGGASTSRESNSDNEVIDNEPISGSNKKNVETEENKTSETVKTPKQSIASSRSSSKQLNSSTNSKAKEKVEEKDKGKLEELSIYDMDTESDEDTLWMKDYKVDTTLPPLPPFLRGTTLALLDDLSQEDRKLLTRYIKAHQGSVADEKTDLNTLLYVITEESSAIDRVQGDYPQLVGIKPEWIWRSHDEAKLLPASEFRVK